ncbi:MAG: hypothetical protein ACXWTY_10515 [Methylobacter sp.]
MAQQDATINLDIDHLLSEASILFYKAEKMTRSALAVLETSDGNFKQRGEKDDCLVYQLEHLYELLGQSTAIYDEAALAWANRDKNSTVEISEA